MRFRLLSAAFLLLGTLAAGVAIPLHEMHELRGHEHCAESEGFRHICHDEDACPVCALAALPVISDPAPPPIPACVAPVVPAETLPGTVLSVEAPASAPARAPPVTA